LAVIFLGFGRSVAAVITLLHVFAVVFIVFGAGFCYLALAVAMRWPPHHPRKRDERLEARFDQLHTKGLEYLLSWKGWTMQEQAGGSTLEQVNAMLQAADTEVQRLVEWKNTADALVEEWLDPDTARLFRLSPNWTMKAPDWVQGYPYPFLWQEVVGRLEWLKDWLREQMDL
jgi:hypothetical protein